MAGLELTDPPLWKVQRIVPVAPSSAYIVPTASNAPAKTTPFAALTGPVARGDAAAVADHLRALAEVNPELAQAYRANSLRTAQRAHAPAEVFTVLEEAGQA